MLQGLVDNERSSDIQDIMVSVLCGVSKDELSQLRKQFPFGGPKISIEYRRTICELDLMYSLQITLAA